MRRRTCVAVIVFGHISDDAAPTEGCGTRTETLDLAPLLGRSVIDGACRIGRPTGCRGGG